MTKIKGSGGGGCFPAGVKVLTPVGETAIELLKVGDEVLSFDYHGVVEVSVVEKVFAHQALPTITVEYWGGQLRTTSNHWVLNQYNTFAEIGTLTDLDAIVDQLGHLRPILSISEDIVEPVYNLHVSKNHTFIADGIRVHNGGLGLLTPVIGSGGGGDKGGGGRASVESPDSLRSQQFAKVVDLISEGEVIGLELGAQDIFLDNTPLQNADGSYNFTGFSYQTRDGTQDQTYIEGFSRVESEKVVGVEVSAAVPVVRQLTNPDLDAAVVTIAIPAMASTSTETGDVTGTSVSLKIEVQSNGGGYVAAPIRWVRTVFNMTVLSPTYIRMPQSGSNTTFVVSWVGAASGDGSLFFPGSFGPLGTTEYLKYTLQKRIANSSDTWTIIETNTFSGSGYATTINVWDDLNNITYSEHVWMPASASKTYSIPETGVFEFRIVVAAYSTWGYQTFEFNNAQSTSGYYVGTDIISGKTSTRYQRSYKIPLSGDAPWDIRVTRLTADSTTQYLQNSTWWDTYTEVIDAKLTYPNSAITAISIDSSQFNSIPSRGYHMKGLKIKVPDNYNPLTRVYSGVWLGSFQTVWSDNPAWVFYDLVTNARYGLGQYVNESLLDVGTLYQIAQYCDELVPNGYGGYEPRYTCNLYLQSREEAFHVLSSIASIFAGMVYWSNGFITASIDKPSDVVYQFTNANVIDGFFEYSGSSQTSRHTVALVTWNDPNDRYTQKVEYVEDHEGIIALGVKETEVIAIGCTSRGQAHRLGKRILLTERYLTEVVSFKTGLEASQCYPGAVISIQDNNRAGGRFGGRVASATINTITLDSAITIAVGTTYTISVVLPDATVESRAVTNSAGSYTTLNVATNFTAIPETQSIWVVSSSSLDTQLFKVVAIKESDTATWEISALQYNPSKYAAIDADMQFEPINSSVLQSSTTVIAPSDIVISEELYMSSINTIDTRMTVAWSPVTSSYVTSYGVSWRYAEGNWVNIPETPYTSVEISPVVPGNIEVSVYAKNTIGVKSPTTYATATLLGKMVPPSDVLNFNIDTVAQTSYLSWSPCSELDIAQYEIRYSTELSGATWNSSSPLITNIAHPTASAITPAMSGTYFIKAVDTSGNYSINAATISTDIYDINQYNVVDAIVEQPAFSGIKTNVDNVSGTLQLAGGMLSDWGMLSTVWSMRIGTDIIYSGIYNFSTNIDLTSVYTSRVTSLMRVIGSNLQNVMSGWVPISLADPLAGTSTSTWRCILQIRTTNDNPTTAPVWSDWANFTIGEYTCRAYEFRILLESYAPYVTPVVAALEIEVDMPDRVAGGQDLVCTAIGLSVVYSPAFKVSPALAIAAQGLTTGDYYDITSKSATGFTIIFRNSSGTAIQRTFDWVAKGYGYVI